MIVTINDEYYERLARNIRQATPERFGDLLEEHKQNILAARFNKKSEDVFAENLQWITGRIITNEDRYYKKPDDITNNDLAKLEILRTREGYDYWSHKIGFNTTCYYGYRDNAIRIEYNKPFLLYLADKKKDFTAYQTRLLKDFVARTKELDFQYKYAMNPEHGDHFRGKNLLHVLLEGPLGENKKEVANLLFPQLANNGYKEFTTIESWQGPTTGRQISQTWYTTRYPLHSAVDSGKPENVRYAIEHGTNFWGNGSAYGANPFAVAARKSADPAYLEIAEYLFDAALRQEDGAKILGEGYRTSTIDSHPIKKFAELGNVNMVVALARVNAGIPIIEVEAITVPVTHNLGNYHSVSGHQVVYHPPVTVHGNKTEYLFHNTGQTKSLPYIKQAVFNTPEASYDVYKDIFGKAIEFLVEKNVLDKATIPAESLTEQRYLNFVFSLRTAVEETRSADPSFLKEYATFTDAFAENVRKAKEATNNFETVYQPVGAGNQVGTPKRGDQPPVFKFI